MSKKINKYVFEIASYTILLVIEDKNLNQFIKEEYSTEEECATGIFQSSIEVLCHNEELLYILKSNKGKKRIQMSIPKQSPTFYKEFFLQEFIEMSLQEKNVIFIHGSCYDDNSKIYAFIGPSGSGKTTIIKLLNSNRILSNDTIVLQIEHGKCIIYPSPFDKKSGIYFASPSQCDSLTIFSLVQSNVNMVRDLGLESKFETLYNNLHFLLFSAQITSTSPNLLKDIYLSKLKMALLLIKFATIRELQFNKKLTSHIFKLFQ